MIRTLNVEHREHLTDRPFEEVLAAFNAATGSVEEGFASVTGDAQDFDDFRRRIEEREGTSGFMRFMVTSHGAWLSRFYAQPTKAVMIVLGNPLIAITMLKHDVRAGLNVPVRIYIYEDADGRTHVAYDLPSTLMSDLSDEARAAAELLDEKLSTLVTNIAGPDMS